MAFFGGKAATVVLATLAFAVPLKAAPLPPQIDRAADDLVGGRLVGVNVMRGGILGIQKLRLAKGHDVPAELYQRKLDWLDGKKARIWR